MKVVPLEKKQLTFAASQLHSVHAEKSYDVHDFRRPGVKFWSARQLGCGRLIATLLCTVWAASSLVAQEPATAPIEHATAKVAAAHVDGLIAAELARDSQQIASQTTTTIRFCDACPSICWDILPRLTKSIVLSKTQPPTSGRLIDQCLESEWYGDNWARYWGDVIIFCRSDQRVRWQPSHCKHS